MQIGIIGLGRMGGNISVRLSKHGHEVVLFDRDPKVVDAVHGRAEGSQGAQDLADMIAKLAKPRVVWVMLPAGHITEETIDAAGRDDGARRHHHRRRQQLLQGRHPPRRHAARRPASTTSTSARRAACMASSAATA